MNLALCFSDMTYDVCWLNFEEPSETMSAKDFHKAIKNDHFLKTIQCFQRNIFVTRSDEAHEPFLTQGPCLIVKEIVPIVEFCGIYLELLERPQQRVRNDYVMISYSNSAEPIPSNVTLFRRDLEGLLFPSPNDEKQNRIITQNYLPHYGQDLWGMSVPN